MIPGFVDLQINGWGGMDFSDPDLTEAKCERAFDQIGECVPLNLRCFHCMHACDTVTMLA